MVRYADWAPTRAALVRYRVRTALWWLPRSVWRVLRRIERVPALVDWRRCGSWMRRRVLGPPSPPPDGDFRGWRVTWLADSMWVRTPGDRPDIEITRGCEGVVTEYVRPGGDGDHGYRIVFDNGAVFGTYLPAPRVIGLERPSRNVWS
ncbi:MAG: hypothetical protein ACT4NY_01595 [Pseudonocardiales bacterium]